MKNRAIDIRPGLVLLAAVGLLAGPLPAGAAGGASLTDVAAGCESFSLTASFWGTVDEGEGLDYVQLRVLDAGGNVVYVAEPWSAPYGEVVTTSLAAAYQQTPVAGPMLFVLEDYELPGMRRLQSIASVILIADCPAFPRVDLTTFRLTCTARLRTGPGLNYRWREFLPEGTTVTAIGRLFDSSWLEVRAHETGRLGWVFDGLCVPGSPQAGTYSALPVTFFRTADEVLLYEAATP